MDRLPYAFENLGPVDRPLQVRRELGALANNVNHDERRPRPKVIGLCECLGKQLPDLWHYGHPIRDRSLRSRANLALYVRDDLRAMPRWVDLRETWPRTKHDGRHEPRSLLVAPVNGWRVIVGHAPPDVPGADAARDEWVDAVVHLLRTPGPVVLLSDPNGLGNLLRDHLPDVVGKVWDGEAVQGRHVVIQSALRPGWVNGVPMLTDHGVALLGRSSRRPD